MTARDITPTVCGVHGTRTTVVLEGVTDRETLRCYRCDLQAALNRAQHAAAALAADPAHGDGCECAVCWTLVGDPQGGLEKLRSAYAEALTVDDPEPEAR